MKIDLEEAPRTAADTRFQRIMELHVKEAVAPAVYTQLLEAADAVARAHFGRGYIEGGRCSV